MKNLFLLFLMLLSTIASSQEQKLLISRYESVDLVVDKFVGIDKFGFQYFIKNNVLFKQKDGQSLEYKNLSLGKITRVDLQNPLKLLLFYEDFNTIVTLDNQLNETQRVNFSENTTPIIVSATGIASQNRFWIYNSLTQQLGLYDYLKNTLQPLASPFQENLNYYDSDFNYFQWIDEKGNWNICDVFGKITTIGKVDAFERLQFIGDRQLLYSNEGQLHILDLRNDKKYILENVDKSFESFYYKDQILSIFTAHGITNYKITIP
ncbi:hypothetical protein J2X31_000349 [Flavobacterium arsenatis]|uniref:Glutamine cyclotransferase n=1 Tax=Flavobacterium arsenatis TaxID=1484332 RepID=A0ABU1TKI1_9FLAO|nr:hypothetical protein [Flavobacterium arsenatis]MDR6966356.1 hypothetical protein [Flavobacterium arsenatis]